MLRRLERVSAHVVAGAGGTGAGTSAGGGATKAVSGEQLTRLFGPRARAESPLMLSGGGLRLFGVDLRRALSPEQAEFLVDALAKHRLICIAGQDVGGGSFTLRHFERFANHYGAVVPHPNNFRAGGGDYADADTADVELLPLSERRGKLARIPGQLEPLAHDSPAVLTVANFANVGSAPSPACTLPSSHRGHDAGPTLPDPGAGGGFHTDVEYEPDPIAVSMFLVHAAPTARTAAGGTWVADTGQGDTARAGARFFRQGRARTAEGQRLRHSLKPLNGATTATPAALAYHSVTLARLARPSGRAGRKRRRSVD